MLQEWMSKEHSPALFKNAADPLQQRLPSVVCVMSYKEDIEATKSTDCQESHKGAKLKSVTI